MSAPRCYCLFGVALVGHLWVPRTYADPRSWNPTHVPPRPLLPDPKPEELFIYLHAIKYETDKWSFEDELPWWAREDWGSATQETTDRPASAASLGRHPSLAAQAKGNDVKGAQTTGNRWTPPAQTRILDVPEKRPETPSAVGERLSSSHSLPAIALEVFKGGWRLLRPLKRYRGLYPDHRLYI